MLNVIWLGLIVIAVVVGAVTGNMQAVTDGALSFAETAVELAIGLTGVMALWLGIMKIAEKSGLVSALGKFLAPVMTKLFPDVPPEHPAMGAMIMNIAANMLGLGNAATPMGIKAMKELQELNEHKTVATNAMCMFLAINTSSVTLIPATVIAIRASAGSANATEIIGPAIFATTISTTVAIISAYLLSKAKGYKMEKFITEEQAEIAAEKL